MRQIIEAPDQTWPIAEVWDNLTEASQTQQCRETTAEEEAASRGKFETLCTDLLVANTKCDQDGIQRIMRGNGEEESFLCIYGQLEDKEDGTSISIRVELNGYNEVPFERAHRFSIRLAVTSSCPDGNRLERESLRQISFCSEEMAIERRHRRLTIPDGDSSCLRPLYAPPEEIKKMDHFCRQTNIKWQPPHYRVLVNKKWQ